MADNIQLNSGSGGDVFAADDIGGIKYQRSKIVVGADGSNDGDVSSTNPLPVDNSNGLVSTDNSTTANLGGAATYTGTWEDCSDYSSITVVASADVAGTLYVDFSTDNSTADRTVQLSDGTDGSFGIHTLIVVAQYFRVRVINGATPQSSFYVQSILCKEAKISLPTSRLAGSLSDYTSILNVRAALAGKAQGSNFWTPITASPEGLLGTAIKSPLSAFGEVSTISPIPTAQVDFVYGINTLVTAQATTGSGSVSSANQLLTVDTTAASSSSAQLTSERYLNYRPGQGALARFTASFTSGGAANSTQLAGIGDPSANNGFFFGYDGTSFGICRISGGTETWVSQANWNIDVCDGTNGSTNKSGINLDVSKINVFEIRYQYLGAGNIFFGIENPVTGLFSPVHQIKFAGANTTTSVEQPSLNLMWRVVNTTNATSIAVKGASGALFVEGISKVTGPEHARENNKATITTETNIFTLRNATTYNGKTNRAYARLKTIAVAANKGGSISGLAVLKVTKNTTLGGSPSYTTTNGSTADDGVTITSGQSVTSYDTAGTTLSGGNVLFAAPVVVGGNEFFQVSDLNIFIAPGEDLTFSFSSDDSCSCSVAATWSEDL
jgi:hypothetical protein